MSTKDFLREFDDLTRKGSCGAKCLSCKKHPKVLSSVLSKRDFLSPSFFWKSISKLLNNGEIRNSGLGINMKKLKHSIVPPPRENYSEFQVKFLVLQILDRARHAETLRSWSPHPCSMQSSRARKSSEKQQLDGTPTATPFINLLLDLRLW